MAGINLSDGIASESVKRKPPSFDAGFIFSVVLLVIVLGVWGGLRYFMMDTDKKIATLDAQIQESDALLHGDKVDKVLAFDLKRENIEKNFDNHADIDENLRTLENLIVPNVRLTKYEYDHGAGSVVISGVTSDYKYLAQQLISLKTQSQFESMRVASISNSDTGEIVFTLRSDILSK